MHYLLLMHAYKENISHDFYSFQFIKSHYIFRKLYHDYLFYSKTIQNYCCCVFWLSCYNINNVTDHEGSKDVAMWYGAPVSVVVCLFGVHLFGGYMLRFLRREGGSPLQHKRVHGTLKQRLNQAQTQDLYICGERMNIPLRIREYTRV